MKTVNRNRIVVAGFCLVASSFALALGGCGSATDSTSQVAAVEQDLRGVRFCDGPRGASCSSGEYCNAIGSRCPGRRAPGVCATEPQICNDLFKPVCGCDGNTYPNACNAAAAGVAVASQGACAKAGGKTCGGIAGLPCPGTGQCVDDPSDSCDPANGGADCSGICTCVETELCVRGSHFDSDPAVCACVPAAPVTCGKATCPDGEVCCNASCGTCTPPGFACSQIACQ